RIPTRAGKDANAVTRAAVLIVHAEGNRLARGRCADAFLILSPRAVTSRRIGEHAVEHELLPSDGERRRIITGSRREWAHTEAIDEPIREKRGRGRERQRVHDEDEVPGLL